MDTSNTGHREATKISLPVSSAVRIWLVYSVVFTLTCVFLLYRTGAYNWSGWESTLLGILMWGGASFAWLSVTVVTVGLMSITGGVTNGWVEWAIAAVAFFFAVASFQFCVLRFLVEFVVWIRGLVGAPSRGID